MKAGFFDEVGQLVAVERAAAVGELRAAIARFAPARALVASVAAAAGEVREALELAADQLLFLQPDLPLPIQLAYATPQTLGADRIAAAAGAARCFPGEPRLILDAGTCLKCDLLTAEGTFQGGSISPGLAMRYRALTAFTGRLPVVAPTATTEGAVWPGNSTQNSIRAGVEIGFVAEAQAFIGHAIARDSGVRVILTGGDAAWLAPRLQAGADRNFVLEPNLVLYGLYHILLHNA